MDTIETRDDARTADMAAIAEVVEAVEHAQRHELVDDFVALFRPDAIWTTGGGRVLIGRDEIAAFTAQVLPGAMTDLDCAFEVVHVLFIRPDVAAVKVRQRYTSPTGSRTADEGEGTPLFVMAQEDGRWWLTACQNTPVVES